MMGDKEKRTPARINSSKGTIEVSKDYFKRNPQAHDFMASHEILHFEHHRKNKALRKNITGRKVHEFIVYLSDCNSESIKDYVKFLKKDFWFKLLWYRITKRFTTDQKQQKKDLFEADINAIKMYLRLGHSKKEAMDMFCKVFKSKDSNDRYNKLKKHIEKL